MRFIQCTADLHADAILEIFNEVILNTTVLYEYTPRTRAGMASWFAARQEGGFPLIGAVDDNGRFMGFATYERFRSRPGYKYTVEHSVYVHKDHRGKGAGRALLERIIAAAREQQYHVIIGAIDASNTGSIALHEKLGFTSAGVIRQAGFKFGRWLDLALYQLILDAPAEPKDG